MQPKGDEMMISDAIPNGSDSLPVIWEAEDAVLSGNPHLKALVERARREAPSIDWEAKLGGLDRSGRRN